MEEEEEWVVVARPPVPSLDESLEHFGWLLEAYFAMSAGETKDGPPLVLPTNSPYDDPPPNERVLETVLHVYERSKSSDEGIVSVTVDASNVEQVLHQLERMGFVVIPRPDDDGAGKGVMMQFVHHAQLGAYEETKNRARSTYHARRAQQHEADFIAQVAALFDIYRIVHEESSPKETLFLTDAIDEEITEEEPKPIQQNFSIAQARVGLVSFVQMYCKVLGTGPFIKGLIRTLESQIGKQHVQKWSLAMSLFTEIGGHSYLSDALSLMHKLRFRPIKLIHHEDGSVIVEWLLWQELSDKEITALLRSPFLSSSLKKMLGAPTGHVESSSIPRTMSSPGVEDTSRVQNSRRPVGLKNLLRKMKI